MIYKLVFAPIEDLDQTASLRVLYIKARVQSFFKVKTKTDQTLGCADGFKYLLCAHDNSFIYILWLVVLTTYLTL